MQKEDLEKIEELSYLDDFKSYLLLEAEADMLIDLQNDYIHCLLWYFERNSKTESAVNFLGFPKYRDFIFEYKYFLSLLKKCRETSDYEMSIIATHEKNSTCEDCPYFNTCNEGEG